MKECRGRLNEEPARIRATDRLPIRQKTVKIALFLIRAEVTPREKVIILSLIGDIFAYFPIHNLG
jgi:hypothetical protein